jgi:DNA polymerase III psi subunit
MKKKLPTRKNQVLNQRQKAYLDAMEIDVWRLRESPSQLTPVVETTPGVDLEESIAGSPATQEPGLKLGPGGGGTLLICDTDIDSATRLANDISRALGSVPVWAWPDTDSGAVKLVSAIEENLFTTVAIFGDELTSQFFKGDMPAGLRSANLVQLPSMRALEEHPEARQALWIAFCRAGMVSAIDTLHHASDQKD